MTISQLKALIDANYPDNFTGLINPVKEREVLKAMLDFVEDLDGVVDELLEVITELNIIWDFDGDKTYVIPQEYRLVDVHIEMYGLGLLPDMISYTIDTESIPNTITLGEFYNPSINTKILLKMKLLEE